jgi:hypothetical protein
MMTGYIEVGMEMTSQSPLAVFTSMSNFSCKYYIGCSNIMTIPREKQPQGSGPQQEKASAQDQDRS